MLHFRFSIGCALAPFLEEEQKNYTFFRSKWDFEHSKWDFEHSKWDFEHSKWDFEHSKWDFEHSKWDFEHSKWDFERSKWDFWAEDFWNFSYLYIIDYCSSICKLYKCQVISICAGNYSRLLKMAEITKVMRENILNYIAQVQL